MTHLEIKSENWVFLTYWANTLIRSFKLLSPYFIPFCLGELFSIRPFVIIKSPIEWHN